MIIVVPVSITDKEVSKGFLKAFKLFKSYKNHDLLVVARPRDKAFAVQIFNELVEDCEFKGTLLHVFENDGVLGWPRGCNHYWAETVKFLHSVGNMKPWLWMEMDMVPLKFNWVDSLEAEYQEAGMPFMGNVGDTTTVTSEQEVIAIAKHLVGAAIYPPNIDQYSTLWKHAQYVAVAWDVLCQNEFVPYSHNTQLIQHVYRTEKYKKHVDQVTSKVSVRGSTSGHELRGDLWCKNIDFKTAVLVHGCTDNSLSKIVVEQAKLF
jgi:hypothetical protein